MTGAAVQGAGTHRRPPVAALLVAALAATLLGGMATPTGAAAQVTPDSLAADSTLAIRADTLEQPVDSARLAILDRLNRLNRLPGADSVFYVQDSVRLAQAAAGNRPGSGMDSVATALMSMPGFSLTEYDGEEADFEARNRVLVLTAPDGGRARVVQEGSVFEADTSIVFDDSAGKIRGRGMTTFSPPDADPIDAVSMIYDLQERRGTAYDAETSWAQQGANWRVIGDMPYATPDSTFLEHAQFTSCDIDEPHYHFQTGEIKIVAGNVLVARDVTLYFADVPVAWLPFMAQSLSRGRSSGLLTPRFSVNDVVRTSGGYRRRVSNVGFYWAASDHFDALTSFDWFSDTFFSVTGSMRYNFARQFLQGDLAFRQYWNADGSTELGIDTQHSWEIDERTQLRISGRFISNNDFVRENSFNPQEVTQSIDSEAGLNRRFSWGSLSLSANRRAYLSDDRTEWLLPSANLSLSPITLFEAPSSEASFYNNMSWSASAGVRRNAIDRVRPDTVRTTSSLNTESLAGTARSTISMGRLSFTQSVDLREDRIGDVPEALLLLGDSAEAAGLITGAPVRDVAEATLGWRASVGYQQQLIGSTTLTPNFSFSGSMFRSDTDSLAQNFLAAPSRMSFGATLKTDIYGFFPGFGSFEAIRHKMSPSFDYQWSPESTPDATQALVFGSRALQPRNTISLSLTQTFEAKRRAEEGDLPAADPVEMGPDGLPVGASPPPDPFSAANEAPDPDELDGAPRRMQTTPSVTLLAWRMSVIEYDFVEAEELGLPLSGFQSTRLSNQFSSDFLRGLSLSTDHELFIDEVGDVEGEQRVVDRRFDPHLASVNLGFSIGSNSSIFRWLFGGGGDDEVVAEPDSTAIVDFAGPNDETNIVPVAGRTPAQGAAAARGGSSGGWNANVSYSLQRPRVPTVGTIVSRMISGTLRLQPTENWGVSWRTAYDLEAGAFNDHSIRLTRDLHRWQANFDFLQTATGNWTFRFEVSLLDNRDLKFDYKQRNLDLGLPTTSR